MENKVDVLANAFADALSESEIVSAIQMAKISAMLSATRIEKGMTQKEFADFMGVSQGMVSKWEVRNTILLSQILQKYVRS